jgi:hypothetical protein
VLYGLAEHGAQKTSTIVEWTSAHAVDGKEWIEWATEADLIQRLYGSDIDDPNARWAVSLDRAIEIARTRRASD